MIRPEVFLWSYLPAGAGRGFASESGEMGGWAPPPRLFLSGESDALFEESMKLPKLNMLLPGVGLSMGETDLF